MIGRRVAHGAESLWALLNLGADEMEWTADALCAQTDPEAFFPERGESPRSAQVVCSECLAREACLAFALEHNERFGVWGGVSERGRRRLRRAMRARPAMPPGGVAA